MDRQTVYTTEVPRTVDFLQLQQNAMISLAQLASAILGTATVVDGFTCQPTAPASLAVALGSGQIFQLEPIEASTWSALPADNSAQILKQGISLTAQNLAITPPATVGFSQNFLIEVQYADSDTTNAVLPYVNTQPPYTPLNGPGGSGAPQSTQRKGVVAVQVKAGTAAATGTQTTPSADAGWVGLFVVTVANGQTTITSGNISTLSSAPFISTKLGTLAAAIQSQQFIYAQDTGTANALVVTLSPAPATPPKLLLVKVANPLTGPSTISVNIAGTPTPFALTHADGGATVANDLVANQVAIVSFDGTEYQLPKPSALLAGSVQQSNLATGAAPLPFVGPQTSDNLLLIEDPSAPTTTINVSPGRVRDDSDITNLQLASLMVKKLNTSWAAGGNAAVPQGMLDSGSIGNSQTYHAYLIGRLGLSVTSFSRTSNVATLTISAHGLGVGGTARIIGVGQGMDGLQTIGAKATNTISFANTGADIAATAAGGICDGFDVLASLSYPSPALPSGWTTKQCLGSLLSDGSGLIRAFTQVGADFIFAASVGLTVPVLAPGVAALVAASVPLGVKVTAFLRVNINGGSNQVRISSPDETDVGAANGSNGLSLVSANTLFFQAGEFRIRTNTSAQVRIRDASSSTGTVLGETFGYNDPRRRLF